MSLNKTTDILTVGETDTLKAIIAPTNVTNKAVKWTSSNSTIAKVDGAGKVTSLNVGTVTITAITVDKALKVRCIVTVTSPIVIFKDANLEKAIRNNIRKPTGTLRKSDVINIIKLDARGIKIKDISGIKNLINLKELYLGSSDGYGSLTNNITNIGELKGLTNLTKIDLTYNKITDLSPLKLLTNIQWLDLSSNSISNINSLKGLSKLTHLSLRETGIRNISVIKNLINLKELDLGSDNGEGTKHNYISDIVPLKELTKLQKLDLKWTN